MLSRKHNFTVSLNQTQLPYFLNKSLPKHSFLFVPLTKHSFPIYMGKFDYYPVLFLHTIDTSQLRFETIRKKSVYSTVTVNVFLKVHLFTIEDRYNVPYHIPYILSLNATVLYPINMESIPITVIISLSILSFTLSMQGQVKTQ